MRRMAFLALLVSSVFVVTGCGGAKLVSVEGTVKLDGKPVEGATVTFVSDDGKNSFAGTTDSSGHFALQSGEKMGAYPGNYKVTVVKSPLKPGAEATDPSEGMKQMKKDHEETLKEAKAANKAKAGGSDAASKMKMGMGSGASNPTSALAKEKTELPLVYANGTTTTLTATVPSAQPIEFDLKSK